MTAPPADAPWLVADLDACVAAHVQRPRAPMRLGWLEVDEPLERLRVRRYTCWQCSRISYELGQLGGPYVIRRTDCRREVVVVHQTRGVPRGQAWEWWEQLLKGRAV